MRITALRFQVKHPDRVSVFVDNTYRFSLSQNQLLEEKLYVGFELDEDQLQILQKKSDYGKAYERILRYVSLRPRSQREIEQYCHKKHINEEDCQAIMQKLVTFGYINDSEFAKSWIRSRATTKPVSKRRLQAELSQKGIANDLQVDAMEEYDEQAALRQVIAKKQRLTRYVNNPQKLIEYLLRQGFSIDAIKREIST